MADQEPVRRGDDGEARPWHIGTALAVSFTVAVVGAGLDWLAWLLLGLAGYRHHGPPLLRDTVGVLQLVFASVAGAGALVALIVPTGGRRLPRPTPFMSGPGSSTSGSRRSHPSSVMTSQRCAWPVCTPWRGWPMNGRNRQTCVDVRAYLRLPYDPDRATTPTRSNGPLTGRTGRRHTIIRLISAHLRPGAAVSWQGLNFDFTGVVFDGGDFTAARFSGGIVLFDAAESSGGEV